MTNAKTRKADAIVVTIESRILNSDYRPGTGLDERSLADELERTRQGSDLLYELWTPRDR